MLNEFKTGDRVMVYPDAYPIGHCKFKGTVLDRGFLYIIRSDSDGEYHYLSQSRLKRLVKKPLKPGDRANLITYGGKFKCTIKYIEDGGDYAVELDNKVSCGAVPRHRLIRLVKKQKEFKIGDRVKVSFAFPYKYATIISLDPISPRFLVKFDTGDKALALPSELKKLRKITLKVGDRVRLNKLGMASAYGYFNTDNKSAIIKRKDGNICFFVDHSGNNNYVPEAALVKVRKIPLKVGDKVIIDIFDGEQAIISRIFTRYPEQDQFYQVIFAKKELGMGVVPENIVKKICR